jgi:hypothetical protein
MGAYNIRERRRDLSYPDPRTAAQSTHTTLTALITRLTMSESISEVSREQAAAAPAPVPTETAKVEEKRESEHHGLGHKIKCVSLFPSLPSLTTEYARRDLLTGHHHNHNHNHDGDHAKGQEPIAERAGSLGATQELGAQPVHAGEIGYGTGASLAAVQGGATGANFIHPM